MSAWTLEEADSYHFQWTIICPTCLSELSGIIPIKGWMQFDPTCPKCKRMIAGFTNPCWPPAPGFLERLLAVIMLRCCRVLDFINAALRWILAVVDNYDAEMRCNQ